MVRRRGRRRHDSAARRLGEDAESGSAVVAALALAVVLAVVAGTVTARSVGAIQGAAALHDRVHARSIAEDVLHAAIFATDELATRLDVGVDGIGPHLRELSDTIVGSAAQGDAVKVDVRTDRDAIHVRVDATVGTAIATATAKLRPRSSADLAWLAESSARDPMLQRLPRIACTWPVGDERRHPACRDMPLPTGDVGGHVHSNDSVFLGPDGPKNARVTSSSTSAIGAAHRSEVMLPRDASTGLSGRVPTCRFRGPTLLRFDGPRVRVTSPRSVIRSDDPEGPERAIGCLGIDRALLAGVVVVELPSDAIIEIVDDEASDCVLHPLGLDIHEDQERAWRCDAGDAFVWGRYIGSRSVVAHGSIQLVWDLEPGDASAPRGLADADVLGLVAGESIVLRRPIGRHPVTLRQGALPFAGPGIAPFGAYPLDAPSPVATEWNAPKVVAAMVALRGSFAPQNSATGPPSGPITIIGSVAARFAPATVWDLRDFLGRPAGTLEHPLSLTYDGRLAQHPPPGMPRIDGGRLRVVEFDVG